MNPVERCDSQQRAITFLLGEGGQTQGFIHGQNRLSLLQEDGSRHARAEHPVC